MTSRKTAAESTRRSPEALRAEVRSRLGEPVAVITIDELRKFERAVQGVFDAVLPLVGATTDISFTWESGDGRRVDRLSMSSVDRVAEGRITVWQAGRRAAEIRISDPFEASPRLWVEIASVTRFAAIDPSNRAALERLAGDLTFELRASQDSWERPKATRWSRFLIWLGSRA